MPVAVCFRVLHTDPHANSYCQSWDLKRQAESEAEAAFRRALQNLPEVAVLKHARAFAGIRKEILVSIQSLSEVIRRKKEEGRGRQEHLEEELQQLEQQAGRFQQDNGPKE
ncbi:hypothetical protein CBR_g12192 [Chara braunii]|uniref:Uncharacterized protein n=1 Tax=Chara braunii TaxID=69332 RepID=A0A388KRG0_CHABU|nr:hypothetical protein CBR_g12192 [Chara braunii]|eukprot:GBG72619.1 hypothetical protein CBR_g12192 [Chara braunii]